MIFLMHYNEQMHGELLGPAKAWPALGDKMSANAGDAPPGADCQFTVASLTTFLYCAFRMP